MSSLTRVALAATVLLFLSSTSPATAQAPVDNDRSGIEFIDAPGEREFSGKMISRPLQLDELRRQGFAERQARDTRARARMEMARFQVNEYVVQTDEYLFDVPPGKTETDVARDLMATGAFQYVEPDWIIYPIGCPDDPQFGSQWHHQANRMQSCDGWDLHTGNPSVGIGFCDTGVRTTHEDLALHRLEGYNAVDRVWESQGGNINAVHPHGTMVTGCGAANGDNGLGVAGVGWNLSHRMMRVSNSSGGGAYSSDLRHAAMTSIEAGDRVASVSYSGVDSSSNLTTATYIKSIGGLLVWAAGNDSRNLTFGNRDNDDLIVAAATDSGDNPAWFTAYGPFVDVAAPGVGVLTTDSGNDSDYAAVNGTSFACPLTAGLCALIWSSDPTLTPNEVESILKQGCDDLGSAGVDNTYGYGRINVFGSISLASGPQAPVADFSGSPTSGTVPLNVSFTDSSSGSPNTWSWTFGDGGSSSAQNPSHTYNAVGTYSVSLTVSNAQGSDSLTRSGYITVNAPPNPPTADFSGSPTSGVAPLAVDFTDSSSGSPTSWSWNFGDGNTSNAQSPSHVYQNAGTFSVSLTVTNSDGSDNLTRSDYISVSAPPIPPVADFVGSPTSGAAPLSVNFTDLSTGSPASWSWDFGDGNSSTAQNPSHVFQNVGSYTVSLTATNAHGSDTMTLTNYIVVNEPSNERYYLSFTSSTTVPGVGTVRDEDIVVYDPASGAWEMYFDGSDVGVTADVDAFHVRADGSLILSLNVAANVPGLSGGPSGTSVDDSDLVLFSFTSSGSSTSGSFSFFLDGSDISLSSNGEDIDGVCELPDGRLAISTTGSPSVSGLSGLKDEDVILFSPTSLGSSTAGSFAYHFDGSDVGFASSSSEDLGAVAFDGADLLFSTRGSWSAAGGAGADEDIGRFSGNFGASTSGSASNELDLSALGISTGEDVDGVSYRP